MISYIFKETDYKNKILKFMFINWSVSISYFIAKKYKLMPCSNIPDFYSRPWYDHCLLKFVKFWPKGHDLIKISRGPLHNATYYISKL